MQNNYKMAYIQLTRTGDVIQTYIAAKQLKVENPNLELTLITRRKLAFGLDFLLTEVFTHIFYFDTKDFFTEPKLNTALNNVHEFVDKLQKHDFDIVLNLSFNKSSSYLTSLIAKKHKMGIYRNNKGELAISDKWSQYIYANVMGGSLNPFNLVDIYKYISGAKEIDVTVFENPKNKVITIHPFASSKKKSWGTTKWNEVIYKLLKDDSQIKINLVGAKSDIEQADSIINSPILSAFSDRIINKVGINSIEDTFVDLSRSQLFIGHDSMVSHLASLFRMPSIIISLGTVRPHETSPYNDRVITLAPRNKCFPCTVSEKCDLLPCHTSINHQVVVAVTKLMLNNKSINWKELSFYLTPFHIDNVSIYESKFDEFGIALKEITTNNPTINDTFRTFYRIIWGYYLANRDIHSNIHTVSNENLKILNNHLEGINYLFELYGHGFAFCNKLLDETDKDNPNIETIQGYVHKLNEIDGLCNITKNTFKYLTPIIDFFYVNRVNAEGNNIIEITNNNLLSFHDSSNIVAILADLIEKTLGPRIGQSIGKGQEI